MSKNVLKEFVFDNFEGGINASTLKSRIDDNELFESVNMEIADGILKTREGICNIGGIKLNPENIPFEIKPMGSLIYTDEDAVKLFFINGKKDGVFQSCILVCDSKGGLNFIRVASCNSKNYDYDIQNMNCICFSGKELFGAGIYIVLSAIDVTGKVCDKFIYELEKNFSTVNPINISDIYAPLVFANGRGESYSDLPISKRTFPSPRLLEGFNAFSSGFKAAYTTDGISSVFYLPCKNLTKVKGENIMIVYTDENGNKFSWTIPYNLETSNEVNVLGKTLVWSVNRSMGKLHLLNNAGEDAYLPMSLGIYNNLVITAYKQPDDDSLFKMSVSCNFNSRVFLSGNAQNGNAVYFSKQNNPLYFPKGNVGYFGDKSANITAISQLNDRLVIFKAHQVGICSYIKTSEINVDDVLDGRTTRLSDSEKMDIKTINTGIGCVYPESILNCANRLLFLGSDKRVYAVTSTSNYLQRFYRVSDKIEPILSIGDESKFVFAIDYNGKYMLFVDDECYSFDHNNPVFLYATTSSMRRHKDNIGWFYHKYNFGAVNPVFAVCSKRDVAIVSQYANQGYATDIVLHAIGGVYDQKMINAYDYETVGIYSKFVTKSTSFDNNSLKKIVGIEAVFGKDYEGNSQPINVYYHDSNKNAFINTINCENFSYDENAVRIIPCIFAVRHFGIEFERASALSVKHIKISYKTN